MLQRHGSQQSRSGLEGHGLLQSPAEWEVRNATLAVTLGDLIASPVPRHSMSAVSMANLRIV